MSIVLVGSTSGSCTLQEQAVAGNTTLTLPTVSGTILTTGSSGQSIPKAALPTGSVLQVVNATYSTSVANNSGTYANTGLTASITPTSSSSKILILVNQNGVYADSNATSGVNIKLLRDSTDLATFGLGAALHNAGNENIGSVSTCYLDSPATTSSTTYKTQFVRASAGQVFVQEGNGTVSTITLLEIAA